MKRARATDLAEELLATLDQGRSDWPLDIVKELHVFGSYSRGATEPHDLDILAALDRTDQRWTSEFLTAMSHGRNPYSVFRAALIGRRRSVQVIFEDPGDLNPVLLWRNEDSLATALARLHRIEAVEGIGRAPRDAMLPAFEGLDRWLPRHDREILHAAVSTGAITLDRVILPDDVPIRDPVGADHIHGR